MNYILASASPRRRELLSQIIGNFTVVPAVREENADKSLPPEEYACALAKAKCDEVAEKFASDLVIACDTIVVFNGKILGKPRDREDAISTLDALSGNMHEVITGVCVISPKGTRVDYAVTKVRFNALSPQFIKAYVDGGSPMDKAGSYGIQDGGIVKEYFGSYTNVVGLPTELVKKLIEEVL